MKHLRLVADDLTGALDSTAQFVGANPAIPVFLDGRPPSVLPLDFAVDGATREMDATSAAAAATRLAPVLAPGPGVISFKKVDSLLRGRPGLELAATLRAVEAGRCVIAPAFPVHGRVTRGGRVFVLEGGSSHRTGEDLRASLSAQGFPVALLKPGESVPEGISLWDAETDLELRAVAEAGERTSSPVLWCGSGGLAAALANQNVPCPAGAGMPLLGLFGSDHPATTAQLDACGGHAIRLREGGSNAALVSDRLRDTGVCIVRFELPHGTGRSAASGSIAREIGALARGIRAPRTLLVAGGETLRALCLSLGTDCLAVIGQVIPGVPVSRMVGGRWDGVHVISKSGAFGDGGLLLRMISQAVS